MSMVETKLRSIKMMEEMLMMGRNETFNQQKNLNSLYVLYDFKDDTTQQKNERNVQ
jgi:hypothetical protein